MTTASGINNPYGGAHYFPLNELQQGQTVGYAGSAVHPDIIEGLGLGPNKGIRDVAEFSGKTEAEARNMLTQKGFTQEKDPYFYSLHNQYGDGQRVVITNKGNPPVNATYRDGEFDVEMASDYKNYDQITGTFRNRSVAYNHIDCNPWAN